MKFLFSFLVSVLLFNTSSAQSNVVFYTTKGEFVVRLYDSIVPITAGNFLSLVNSKYYDGVIFHRVINNFMIQGGDPTGTGSGGPGYTIQDEFDSSLSNIQKTISMANSGPNTGGSQFFINLVNNTYLDFDKPPATSQHPVFGIVVWGFDIVQKIGRSKTNLNNRPDTAVVMDSIRVTNFIPGTGIKENERSQLQVQIFPNPITPNSVIMIESNVSGAAVLSVYDRTGKRIFNQDVDVNAGRNFMSASDFPLMNLDNGVYFLLLNDGKNSYRQKLVVNK